VTVAGRGRRRTVPLDRFFKGVHRTALNGGLLVEVVVPAPAVPAGARAAFAFHKLGRLESDIAVVNAAAGVVVERSGVCRRARIALGAVAPTPLRARAAEARLEGKPFDAAAVAAAAAAAAAEAKPVTDVRATAGYRREMCRVLVARALADCLARLAPEAAP